MKIIENLGKLRASERSKHAVEYVIAECFCGTRFKVIQQSVTSGRTKSCGCLRHSAPHLITTRPYRDMQPRLYRIWKNMRTRVNNPNIPQANCYGARGISLCAEWDDFVSFYTWALASGYNDSLSIDRIDVDGNYEPSNCKWSTHKEQSKNTQLLRSSNSSGYRGVAKKGSKYSARATNDRIGKRVYLGAFDSPEDAAIAYDFYVLENDLEYPTNFLGTSRSSQTKDATIQTLAGNK